MARHVAPLVTKTFVYSLIPSWRHDDVIDCLGRYFYTNETVCKNLRLFTDGTLSRSARKLASYRLQQGTSLYAYEQDTKRIAGAMVSCTVSDEHSLLFSNFLQEIRSRNRSKYDALTEYFALLLNHCKTLQEFTGFDKIFELQTLLVVPQFSGSGVARQLLQQSVQLGLELDVDLLVGNATAHASRYLLKDLGFRVLNQVKLRDIRLEGEPLTDDPDACASLMALSKDKK